MTELQLQPLRLHVFGASGSGTTTLGLRLAAHYRLTFFDTDDFFWAPTDPPYEVKRPPAERLELMQVALQEHEGWVLSGSLCGWGDPVTPLFDAAIFVTVPPELRLERTRQRERERFGAALEPGGALHRKHVEFMAWSAGYDDPTPIVGRSRVRHEEWLSALPCPVIRVENVGPLDQVVSHVVEALSAPRSALNGVGQSECPDSQ